MYRDFPYTPCHSYITSPNLNIFHQSGTFVTADWYIIITQSPCFTLQFVVGIYSMGLDNCVMICVHHYGIRQSIFTALKMLCAPASTSSPSAPVTTTDIFALSIVLPFLECHIFKIIHYVDFLD